jgi:hypothetical protein
MSVLAEIAGHHRRAEHREVRPEGERERIRVPAHAALPDGLDIERPLGPRLWRRFGLRLRLRLGFGFGFGFGCNAGG